MCRLVTPETFPSTKKWKESQCHCAPLSEQTVVITRRDRPKSAPYLRLKNRKSTSKNQVFFSTVPVPHEEKIFRNFFEIFSEVSGSRIVPKNVKGRLLGFFEHPFCCKIEKNEVGEFWRL